MYRPYRDFLTDLVIFLGIVIFTLFVGTVWAVPA